MDAKSTPSITLILQKIDLDLGNSLPEEAARQIAETAHCLFDADYVAVIQHEKANSKNFLPLAEAGSKSPHETQRQQWLMELANRVADSGRILQINDLISNPQNGSRFTVLENISCYAAMELLSPVSQTPLATLYLEYRNARQYVFSEDKLNSFAEQAQTLLQNAWLVQRSERLNKIREQAIKADDTIKKMIDWLRGVAQADLVTIFPYYEALQRFDDLPHLSGQTIQPGFYRPSYFRPDDIAWLAVKHHKSEFASNSKTLYQQLNGPEGKRLGYFEERENVMSSAEFPLWSGKELVGVLFFNFRLPQKFGEEQRKLLANLADFAAQTLVQVRQRGGQAERHVKELRLLDEIDQQIKGDLNLEDLLDEILKLAQEHIKNAEDATAMLYDSRARELFAMASRGPNREKHLASRVSLREGDVERSIQGWACFNHSPARVGNVKSEEWKGRYKQVVESTVSELDIPLFDGKQLIGLLSFESSKPEAFSAEDLNFLVTLSNRAVHVISKASSREREQAIDEILKAGQEIFGVESSKQVLDKILVHTLKITDSIQGAIFLHDLRWDDLYVVAEIGGKEEKLHKHINRGEGILGRVLESKQSLIVNTKEEKWRDFYLDFFKGDVGWQLIVPILKGQNEVRGMISIERPSDDPFTQEELDAVERMAVLAEIALRNAEHYEMRQRLTILHKVDEAIIEQLDYPELVLWIILEQSLLLTEAEYGDLHIYQNGKPCTTYFSEKKDKKIAKRDKLEDSKSEELARGIVSYVAETKKAYRTREDAQTDPKYVKGDKNAPTIHSEIAVPLLDDKDLIGVLNLESVNHDDLTEDDVELMQLIAGQAVIAYQNALRYRQEQEATKRFQTLRDVGLQLSEVTDIDDIEQVYKIVGEQLMAFQPGWITIRRYDESSRSLERKFHRNPTNEETRLPPHKIGEGPNGYIAQRWLSGIDRSGKAVVIPDVLNPPPGINPAPASDKVRTQVSAPVYFKDKYYGSLSLSHEIVDFFKDKDIELIEGLAAQLGITIHRLEVTREKQEAEQRIKAGEAMAHHAANVAHRYSNTFTPVLTQAEKLRRLLTEETMLSPKIEAGLNEFTKRAKKARELNKQFRDLADGMKVGALPDETLKNVVLRELLADVIANFNTMEDNANESLVDSEPNQAKVEYRYGLEFEKQLATVRVVSEQVKAILSNLIGNAQEAMPTGGTLTFKARNLQKYVELQITDVGPGVPESISERIFEFGFTTKKSTGFGLAIAQYYARNNGGDLRLGDSQPRQGATFILLLPRADNH